MQSLLRAAGLMAAGAMLVSIAGDGWMPAAMQSYHAAHTSHEAALRPHHDGAKQQRLAPAATVAFREVEDTRDSLGYGGMHSERAKLPKPSSCCHPPPAPTVLGRPRCWFIVQHMC